MRSFTRYPRDSTNYNLLPSSPPASFLSLWIANSLHDRFNITFTIESNEMARRNEKEINRCICAEKFNYFVQNLYFLMKIFHFSNQMSSLVYSDTRGGDLNIPRTKIDACVFIRWKCNFTTKLKSLASFLFHVFVVNSLSSDAIHRRRFLSRERFLIVMR